MKNSERLPLIGTAVLLLNAAFINTAGASELDINISDDAANLQFTIIPKGRDFSAGVGYIYGQDDVDIVNLDLHARGQTVLGNLPTTVGIGIQVNYFSEGAVEGTALGLGGNAHIKIPAVPGLGIKTVAHYAPSITSFGDAEHVFRAEAKLTYRVIQNADISAGYRIVKSDLEDAGSLTLEEGGNIGFTLIF